MARYAVKLGEIHLTSDTPITTNERNEAIKTVQAAAREVLSDEVDGLKIEFVKT